MPITNVSDVEISVIYLMCGNNNDWQLDSLRCLHGTTNIFSSGAIVERYRDSGITTVGGYQPITGLSSGVVRERRTAAMLTSSMLAFSWIPSSPVTLDRLKFVSTYASLNSIAISIRVYTTDNKVYLYYPYRWGSVYADPMFDIVRSYAEARSASDLLVNLDDVFNATRDEELWVNGGIGLEDFGHQRLCVRVEAVDGQPTSGCVLLKQKRGEGLSPITVREARVEKGGIAHFYSLPKGIYSVTVVPDAHSDGAPTAFDVVVS